MAAAAAGFDGAVWNYGAQFLCVWLVGLVLGWLLPKPKWADRGVQWVNRGIAAKNLLLATPPGLWVRRVALAAHAALIIKEVWRNLFVPGTFRGVLRNLWRTLTTGARFEWPQPAAAAPVAAAALAASPSSSDDWYIGEKDLADFRWTIEEGGRPEGASEWEPLMHKEWPGCTYTAWRRTLASGKSEYKSVTLAEDATAEEFMDFYLDDEARMQWDGMISETQLLESGGDPAQRRQVVRWLRTFPFAFLSQREYVIARRFFRGGDGALYALTRGLPAHPAAPEVPGRVRMEGFHSHWRSRDVPCPRGSGRPAVETTLLHFEDFRINERLARFAVRHGMAGFVKGMIPAVQRFVAERRTRCGPHAEDPASFGRRQLAPSPLQLARSASLASSCDAASLCSLEDSASERSAGSTSGSVHRSSSIRRLGAMMLASGVAIALARSAGSPAEPAPAPGSRHGHGHAKKHGQRHLAQRHHHGGHVRRGDGAPRARRRLQDAPAAEPEPAALAAMTQG